MDTCATPGTLISRGRIFHRASTDMSIRETDEDGSPDHRDAAGRGRRLDHRRAGVPTFGSACACVIRSWTICRAAYRSVPGSKTRSIADRPGIEPGGIAVEPRDAVEQVLLERHRDQLLDLRGGQAERLGLDLDRGRPELRVDVDAAPRSCTTPRISAATAAARTSRAKRRLEYRDPSGHVADPLRVLRSRRRAPPDGVER